MAIRCISLHRRDACPALLPRGAAVFPMSEKKLLEHLDRAEIEAFLKDLHKDDGPSHYDKDWLKQENERRSAQGLPPLHERKRKALDRERFRVLNQITPPGEYINPDYELVEACPATRGPVLAEEVLE